MQLVDEQDDVLVLSDLVHDRLEALLELTAILGAGDDGCHIQRQHAVLAQRIRALTIRYELGKSLDDGRLADTRLADEDRIVFLATRKNLHHALDFLPAANRRIQLIVGGELGEVSAEVIERGSLRLLLSLARLRLRCARRSLRSGWCPPLWHFGAEQAQRLRLRGVEINTSIGQNLSRDTLLLAEQTEQQVLGADITMTQIAGFAHGELEHFLGARCIWEIGSGRGCGLTLLHGLLDFLLNFVEVDAEILEDGGSDSLTFTDEAEQYVLGTDVFVMEARSLLTGHGENLSDSLCEVVTVHLCDPQCGS